MHERPDKISTTAPRAWLGFIIRVGVSAALLVWLLRRLDGVLERIQDIEPAALWPAALVFMLSTCLGALQWSMILRHSGIELPMWRLSAFYWIGLFFNNFLPSTVGGDVIKVADVAQSTGKVARPAAGTLLDRILGLVALSSIGVLSSLVLGGSRPAGIPWWVLSLVALGLVTLGSLLLSKRLGAALLHTVSRIRLAHLGDRLGKLLEELRVFRNAPRFLAQMFAMALLVQAIRVLTHVMVAQAMGLQLDREMVLGLYVLVPLLGVILVLPITFNGWGLRGNAAERLLPAGLGVTAQDAVALQLTTFFIQMAVSTLGGVLLVIRMVLSKRGGRSG